MLHSKILRKFLIVMMTLVVVCSVAIMFVALPKIDRTIKELEEQNAKEVLEKVVLLTNDVAKNLENFKKVFLENHKQKLRDMIDLVHTMLAEDYKYSLKHPEERALMKQKALERIRKLRYGDHNYIFAVDYNGTVLAHPYIPYGTNMYNVRDIKENLIVPRLIDVAREEGEGFTRYWWPKHKGAKQWYEKLTYSRQCPKWDMVIGTGVFIDDINWENHRRKQELIDELRDIVERTRIGKSGYIYIFDEKDLILHPDRRINSKNFKALVNPATGRPIYRDLIAAAKSTGVLHYKWDKPTDKGNYRYDKISWVGYVPSMGLYVASSVYVDELEAASRHLHREIIYIGGVILFVSLLFVTYYLYRMLRPIQELADTAREIAEGNFTMRVVANSDDEVGVLARYFNRMVDRLEEQISTLDMKVQEKTKALRELAVTDALTGLYNRRYFSEISTEMFSLGKRENEPLSVIMLDIDRFKNVNDTYGHQAGDKVIVLLSKILEEIKRQSDIACRYGGEEFVLLLPKTDQEGAYELAERIRKQVEKSYIVLEETKIGFTVSLGVAEAEYGRDSNIEEVIRRADDAMYIAKRDGRNRTRKL